MTELDDFFKTISDLRDKYKDKGEFNAFHSIGFRHQELMHSKFIATLLDPKSQHGKKNQFLELFLTQIGILDFNTTNIAVCTEKRAQKRSIDITIENNDSIIIIENKVWAADQLRQLEDYHNFCKNTWKRVEVVYLTPYGHSPSQRSLGEILQKEHVRCISYEKSIIPWIEDCAKLSDGRLQHSLQMYVEVLRVLINRDKYMNEIFEYLIKDKEKLKLAIDINLALQGRNHITKESIGFLISRTCKIVDGANPHPEDELQFPNFNIASEVGHEFEHWRFCFEDDHVYVTNFLTQDLITLFLPSDINNEKLRSIMFEDVEYADVWLSKLFDDMRKIK